ncbi:ligated ion channel l-glutamate- and glycine-binding site domain-containing protein [Phthorimaea operculella]|nr:ligated ion channel l-glutamate- and glycine-binding site domain-containing protein [Phthorimaea operculella]
MEPELPEEDEPVLLPVELVLVEPGEVLDVPKKVCDAANENKYNALLSEPDDLHLLARQLPEDDDMLRDLMLVLKKAGYVNFLVWGDEVQTVRVLDAAQRVGLLAARHSYILLSYEVHTQDLHDYSHGGANITGLMLFNPDANSTVLATAAWLEEYEQLVGQNVSAAYSARSIPSALLLAQDAALLAARALDTLQLAPAPADCTAGYGASNADTLLNYIRSEDDYGVTGTLSWEADGWRRHIVLQVVELQRGGELQVAGSWSEQDGVQWTREPVEAEPLPSDSMSNRTFTVMIAMVGAAAGGGQLQVAGSCRWRRAAGGGQLQVAGSCRWRQLQVAGSCRWRAAAGGGQLQVAGSCRWRAAAGGGQLQVAGSCRWRAAAGGGQLQVAGSCRWRAGRGAAAGGGQLQVAGSCRGGQLQVGAASGGGSCRWRAAAGGGSCRWRAAGGGQLQVGAAAGGGSCRWGQLQVGGSCRWGQLQVAGSCRWRAAAGGGQLQVGGSCRWRAAAGGGQLQVAGSCRWGAAAGGGQLQNDPYVMKRESTERLSGNKRYEGFCIELIETLAEMLNFNYTFVQQEGNNYGKYNKDTGEWDGMLRAVMDDKSNLTLAITDLTITEEREKAVDFTTPFMNLGIAILFRKPKPPEPKMFAFLLPFSSGVWMCLGLVYVASSLLLYVVGRLCPEEWQNPYPCIEEPVALENQFTLGNAFWFNLGAILLQGSEVAPVGYSTRAVASVWWLFALVITSSYTANLASLLAAVTPNDEIHDVQELAYNDKGIKYGAKATGSTYTFFEHAKAPIYEMMFQNMKKWKKLPNNNTEGINWAAEEKENFAYLMESTSIEYVVERNCRVYMVGEQLDSKGYGIAMAKSSPYRQELNLALLRLQESGKLREMKHSWWKERNGGGACEELNLALLRLQESGKLREMKHSWWKERNGGGACEAKADVESPPLEMNSFYGLFLVLIVGCLVGVLLSCGDLALHTRRRPREPELSFWQNFLQELRFVFHFELAAKPVKGPLMPPKTPSIHSSELEELEKKYNHNNITSHNSPLLHMGYPLSEVLPRKHL